MAASPLAAPAAAESRALDMGTGSRAGAIFAARRDFRVVGVDLNPAGRSTDVLERFAAGLPAALAPGGRALVLLSTDGDTGGMTAMLASLARQGLAVTVAARRHAYTAPAPLTAGSRSP